MHNDVTGPGHVELGATASLMKRAFLVLVFLLAFQPVPAQAQPGPAALYVSPSGSDANACTLNFPCLTIPRATSLAGPGATVYVRAGVYYSRGEWIINARTNITVTAHPADIALGYERPIIDATYANLGPTANILYVSGSHTITVSLIEFRNSTGRGIASAGTSDHITFYRVAVHHVGERCVGLVGSYITLDSSNVYECALNWRNSAASGGWPGGVSSWWKSGASVRSDHVAVVNTLIQRVYGEGLIFLHADYGAALNVAIFDTKSVNLYIDDAINVSVDRLLTNNNDPAFLKGGRYAHSLQFGNEGGHRPATAITVTNSSLAGGDNGIFFFCYQPVCGYGDVVLANNRVDARSYSIKINSADNVSGVNVLSGNVFSGTLSLAQPSAWNVVSNISSELVTLTPTPTRTATQTRTATWTSSPSSTPSLSPSPTASDTGTASETPTPTETGAESLTPTSTSTGTNTATNSPTRTRTRTPTRTRTRTATWTRTITPTQTASASPSQTPTVSPSPLQSPTATSSPTDTPLFTLTPTETLSATTPPNPTPTSTRTATSASASVRFAVIGDFGHETSGAADDVARLIDGWGVEFIATVGDNCYYPGDQMDRCVGQYYSKWIYPYFGNYGTGEPNGVNRFWPSMGNHEYALDTEFSYWRYFTLPGNERYYTLRRGDVELFMVNSNAEDPDGNTSNSPQAVWLRNAMAASDATWKFVLFHHPPYSTGSTHGGSPTRRWPYLAWGADAVLSGHEHNYERLFVDGLVYFVNGLGGRSLYSFNQTPVPGSQVRYGANYGAQLVECSATSCRFRFITRAGVTIDDYVLTNP